MQVSFKQSPQAVRATTKSSDVTRIMYASRAVPMALARLVPVAARNAVVGLIEVADVEGMRTEHIARKSRECNDIDKSNPILYTAVLCVHGCMRMCMHMSDASPCRRVSNLRHTDHRPSASFRTPRYARRRLMRLGGQ